MTAHSVYTGTSIKSGVVKLLLWTEASPLCEMHLVQTLQYKVAWLNSFYGPKPALLAK